jgi:hypothetical protein
MGHPLIRGRDRNWTGRFSRTLFSPTLLYVFVARLKSCPDTQQNAVRGVLRLRATSAMSRDKSVRRFAQDDDLVGILTKNLLNTLVRMGSRDNPG